VEYYTASENDTGSGDRNTDLIMGTIPSFELPQITEGDYEWIISPKGLGTSAHPNIGGDVEVTVDVKKLFFPCPVSLTTSPYPSLTMTSTGPLGDQTLLSIPCGTTEPPTEWISSTSTISVVLKSEGYTVPKPQIELGFFSRTPHYKCGFPETIVPGVFRQRSFGITDGSYWHQDMEENLNCFWKIDPEDSSGVTLAFNDLDVRGGALEVIAGDTGEIIWSCDGCSLPPAKITYPTFVTVRLSTRMDTNNDIPFGKGFQMLYYGLGKGGAGGRREHVGAISDTGLRPPTISATSTISPPLKDYWLTVTASKLSLVVSILYADLPASTAVSIFTGPASNPVFVSNVTSVDRDWIVLSEVVHFKFNSVSNFVFAAVYSSYYPVGSKTKTCGLTDVDGIWGVVNHTSGSFMFNDGSEIRPNAKQFCKYLVDPTDPNTSKVFLTFPRLSLVSGWLEVWDLGIIIYKCVGCDRAPGSLMVSPGAEVRFYSGQDDEEEEGEEGDIIRRGWEVMYSSLVGEAEEGDNEEGWEMLRIDEFMERGLNESGVEYLWNIKLGKDEEKAVDTLKIGRTEGKPCSKAEANTMDKSGGVIREVHALDIMKTCGFLKRGNSSKVELLGRPGGFGPENSNSSNTVYHSLDERNAGANLMRFYGKEEVDGGKSHFCGQNFTQFASRAEVGPGYNGSVPNSKLCQYRVTPSKKESKNVNFEITSINMPPGSSIAIHEGSSDLGKPLFMCGSEFVYETFEDGGAYSPMGPIPKRSIFKLPESIVKYTPHWWADYEYFNKLLVADEYCNNVPLVLLKASCGKIYVKIVHNETRSTSRGVPVQELDDGVFEGSFSWDGLKNEAQIEANVPWERCYDEDGWGLKPIVEEQPLWQKVFILIGYVLAGAIAIGTVGGTYYYFEIWLPNQQIQINRPVKPVKAKKIPHAQYRPIMNAFLNRMLTKGECTICFCEEKTFKLPGCKHEVCLDCLRSYIHTALGDASMFPIKCPMHHMGCLTVFEASFAQRVLNRDEFSRFNLFNDRAVYGDGMACIFCGNFVIFPERMSGVMVACPYCRQRFCMKCKVAWHVGVDCTEEGKDDLEDWRRQHGATRCPGCFKVIEKDDPETCNHMVRRGEGSERSELPNAISIR